MRLLEFLAAYFRTGGGRVVERPAPAEPVTGSATMSVPAEPGAIDALNAMLDQHYADARAVVDAGRAAVDRYDADRAGAPTDVRGVPLPPPIAPAPPAETGVNVDLLRRALEHITAHPAEWDQGSWWNDGGGCGTSGCVAGWAVHLGRPGVVMTAYSVWAISGDVRLGGIEEFATDLLGLTTHQAKALFSGGNNLRRLWELSSEFTDGAIVPPAELPDGS